MSRETDEREIHLAAQSIAQRINVTGMPPKLEERAFRALLADRGRLAAELAKAGPSCDRCQSAHCCSVVGDTVPPYCVTDPEGSLPLWMPWTNEDVRKRLDAVYAQADRLTAELGRVRKAMEVGRSELVYLRDNYDHEPDEHYNLHDCRSCRAESALTAMDRALSTPTQSQDPTK